MRLFARFPKPTVGLSKSQLESRGEWQWMPVDDPAHNRLHPSHVDRPVFASIAIAEHHAERVVVIPPHLRRCLMRRGYRLEELADRHIVGLLQVEGIRVSRRFRMMLVPDANLPKSTAGLGTRRWDRAASLVVESSNATARIACCILTSVEDLLIFTRRLAANDLQSGIFVYYKLDLSAGTFVAVFPRA